jgi:hypothetical protein
LTDANGENNPTGGDVTPAATPVPPPATSAPARKSADERKEALARAIHTQVAQGARVESQSDFQAILVTGHRPNHLLHFFIGLVTLGIWWLVWIGIALAGGEKRMAVSVDEWGNTNIQRL